MSTLKYGLEKALEHFPYLGAEKAMSTLVSNSSLFTVCLHTQELKNHRKEATKASVNIQDQQEMATIPQHPKGQTGKAALIQCKVLQRWARPCEWNCSQQLLHAKEDTY